MLTLNFQALINHYESIVLSEHYWHPATALSDWLTDHTVLTSHTAVETRGQRAFHAAMHILSFPCNPGAFTHARINFNPHCFLLAQQQHSGTYIHTHTQGFQKNIPFPIGVRPAQLHASTGTHQSIRQEWVLFWERMSRLSSTLQNNPLSIVCALYGLFLCWDDSLSTRVVIVLVVRVIQRTGFWWITNKCWYVMDVTVTHSLCVEHLS